MFQRARVYHIPGPKPPIEAFLALVLHRMAMLCVERVYGLGLRMRQTASLVVRLRVSRLRGVNLILCALASHSHPYYVPSLCASDVCSFW